ncbi:MAG: glycosyltransferase family 4 protein [Candidatus Micrarchaeota archaeon]
MKAMHVVDALNPGGAQKMFLATLRAMHSSGRTGNVGYVISGPAVLNDPLVRLMRLPSSPLMPFSALLALLHIPFLISAIMREKPDIVYAYHGTAAILSSAIASKISGAKMVARSFGAPRQYRPLERLLWRIIPIFCDAVVVLSEDCRSRLVREGVPENKLRLIRNGKDAPAGASARARLGIGRGRLVVGMAGRITPGKNQASLIRMLPRLKSIRQDVTLIIAGAEEDAEYARSLRSFVSANGLDGNCRFLGFIDDMDGFFRACDIFAHPSAAEAGPGVVIEAMHAGLPVVSFHSGDAPAMLDKCGFLCANEKEVESALVRLIKDEELRKSAGAKAKEKALECYGTGRMVAEYEDLFFSLAKQSPVP